MAKRISRRNFLKLSGAAAVMITVPIIPRMSTWAGDQPLEGSTSFIGSFCEICTSRCPIQGKVVDGRSVYLRGNPQFPATGGTICARGTAGISQLYDTSRLKKPLIRTGARGEGKWREVTYDEAFDYIAQKMSMIKTQYGAEAMAFSTNKGLHTPIFYNLAQSYGSPNFCNHEAVCPLTRTVALETTFGTPNLAVDYANTKYLISLGRNYFEAIHVSQARAVMSAVSRGAKLVVLDPRYSITAAKADEWHAVKPGTDLAFVLALNHVLVRDKLYDAAFIEKYTTGFNEISASLTEYTPAWAESETGISAVDIERIARELAANKPKAVVDWGWRSTSTPYEYDLRRAIIITNMLLGNLEIPGGTFFIKNAAFLNSMGAGPLITGLAMPKVPAFPKPSRPRIDGAGVKGHSNFLVPPSEGVAQLFPEAILTEKPYPIKGWLINRFNPAMCLPDRDRVVEAFKKLDFIAVCEIYMSETAHYADVVLPDSTYLERDEGLFDYSTLVPQYLIRQQVVKPVFDTKPYWEIYKSIGERLGLNAYFPWKDMDEFRLAQVGGKNEIVESVKKSGLHTFGFKPIYLLDKKSVAEFVAKMPGAATLVTDEGVIDLPLLNLKTPSKKIELVSQHAREVDFEKGIPQYRRADMIQPGELAFIQGKVGVHTNNHTHNIPVLNQLMSDNRLWIHPDTAAKLNVKDGDTVMMKSKNGSQQCKVLVTQGIRPDTVYSYYGLGRFSPDLKRTYKKGINCNLMIPVSVAAISGSTLSTVSVKLEKV
ncbi:MAG: trimethylamine-N-oxide reductase [Firmicutes bacterium]|nr:trimethylamine-N-oxide reductase [Bacillota bacterium]